MGAVLKISNYTKKGFTQGIKSDTLFLNDTFEAAKRIENASKKVLPFDSIDEINRVIYELAKRSMRDVCLLWVAIHNSALAIYLTLCGKIFLTKVQEMLKKKLAK